MRVAIVHYWLLSRRGGEAVLEALCRLLPEADLFTLFYDPERACHVSVSSLNCFRPTKGIAAADADRARVLRSARLRPGDQQRIQPGQGSPRPPVTSATATHPCGICGTSIPLICAN